MFEIDILSKRINKKHLIENILLFLSYFVSIFTFNQGLVAKSASIIVVFCMILIFQSNKFYLFFPLLIFFYSHLILPGGVAVFRLYSLLIIIKYLTSKKKSMELKLLIPALLIIFYSLIVVGINDYRISITIILDTITTILYILLFLREQENFASFFRFYSFSAICSIIFGMFSVQSGIKTTFYTDGQWIDAVRFLATFNDPNYLGFFLNIAIFSLVILKNIKNKYFKYILILVLYLGLFASLSITGLICNIVGMGLYILLKKGFVIKYIFPFIVLISLPYIYEYSLNNEVAILTDFSLRIDSEFNNLSNQNYYELTSNRNEIWENHFDYYLNQPFFHLLFGGNFITDFGLDKTHFSSVSHQALIDMLLNFGLLGTFILLLVFLIRLKDYFYKYLKLNENIFLLLLIIKFIWLFYSFSISMFPSWQFNMFFLL